MTRRTFLQSGLPNGEKMTRDIAWQRKGRNAIQVSL